MNATQRKFLVDKINEKTKKKIGELKKKRLEYPSASNYIFKAILNDELELQPKEVILAALKKKAMNAKEGSNWLSEQRLGFEKNRTVTLNIPDLIKIPEDLGDEAKRVKAHNKEIDDEIKELESQLDMLEVRIQLASNKTLQNLINEVDDMGDLSLVDNKLKLLDE